MTIHDAHSQLVAIDVRLEIDVAKLASLEDAHMEIDDARRAFDEHLAVHQLLVAEVARLTSPTKPFVRV